MLSATFLSVSFFFSNFASDGIDITDNNVDLDCVKDDGFKVENYSYYLHIGHDVIITTFWPLLLLSTVMVIGVSNNEGVGDRHGG